MKKIVLSIGIIILLSLTAREFFFSDEEINKIGASDKVEDCNKLDTSENQYRVEKSYAAVAEKTGDESICPKIDHDQHKKDCWKSELC